MTRSMTTEPTNKELEAFIAKFVGWVRHENELTGFGFNEPPFRANWWERYDQTTQFLPHYLDDLNLWHGEVWPRLAGSPHEWEWMDNLCKLCGTDNMTRRANADARTRCLALYITLGGVLP